MGRRAVLERESERILGCATLRKRMQNTINCYLDVSLSAEPLGFTHPQLLFQCGNDDDVPQALAALSIVLHQSFRLNALPRLKARFWKGILELAMMRDVGDPNAPDIDAWLWVTERVNFPGLCIDWSHRDALTSEHLDALFSFCTTIPAKHPQKCMEDSERIPIGLDFSRRNLTPKCLELIQQLLDRVSASTTRRYAIIELSLSPIDIGIRLSQSLVEILRKSHGVYGIEQLRTVTAMRGRVLLGNVMYEGLRHIVSAAIAVNTDADRGLESSVVVPQSLCLDFNLLRLQHVAVICSSFRYGSTFEVLSLCSTRMAIHENTKHQSWRWIAFGLFSLRAKRLARGKGVCRVNLSSNYLDDDGAKAFVNTLRDPVRELVPWTKGQWDARTDGKARLCVVRQGAKVYTKNNTKAKSLTRLESDQLLEVLCQRRGYTCVVLAGFGLGWVHEDQVLRFEEDEFESDRRVELIIRKMFKPDALAQIIESVGHRLSYLDIYVYGPDPHVSLLRTIMDRCANIEHLRLSFDAVEDAGIDEILDALRDHQCDRLRSLDLNQFAVRGDAFKRLTAFLSDSTHSPMLQELRVANVPMEPQALAMVQNLLAANKTLRYLQFAKPSMTMDRESYRIALLVQNRIKETHEGELLPSAFSLKSKIAFLSVVSDFSAQGSSFALDSFVLSTVFKFAADDVRRRIFWNV